MVIFMTKDVNIYHQSSSEINWKYLEASQHLQLDKQRLEKGHAELIDMVRWLLNSGINLHPKT